MLAKKVRRTEDGYYACQLCGSLIHRLHDMKRHVFDLHLRAGVRYKCQYCPSVLKNSNSLRGHMQKRHCENMRREDLEKCAFLVEEDDQ